MSDYDKRMWVDRQVRRHYDKLKGLTRDTGPCRGDYKVCREGDKILADMRRFKDKSDQKKLGKEYEQMQKEFRGKV